MERAETAHFEEGAYSHSVGAPEKSGLERAIGRSMILGEELLLFLLRALSRMFILGCGFYKDVVPDGTETSFRTLFPRKGVGVGQLGNFCRLKFSFLFEQK
jgi:hypothetical protein